MLVLSHRVDNEGDEGVHSLLKVGGDALVEPAAPLVLPPSEHGPVLLPALVRVPVGVEADDHEGLFEPLLLVDEPLRGDVAVRPRPRGAAVGHQVGHAKPLAGGRIPAVLELVDLEKEKQLEELE